MVITGRIEINPNIMNRKAKPVIRGARYYGRTYHSKTEGGATEEDLLEAYPTLIPEDIPAAIHYSDTHGD